MKTFTTELDEHLQTLTLLANCKEEIEQAGHCLKQILQQGGKLLFCGNGGSASDAQHLATELVVRYEKNRKPFPAIALTTDTSILTAHSNDFGFDTVFSRQVEALGNPGDCLIAISTSGVSPNILKAAEAAKAKALTVIALTGGSGLPLKNLADLSIIVPSRTTARIQEAHILIGHFWCALIEEQLSDSNNP